MASRLQWTAPRTLFQIHSLTFRDPLTHVSQGGQKFSVSTRLLGIDELLGTSRQARAFAHPWGSGLNKPRCFNRRNLYPICESLSLAPAIFQRTRRLSAGLPFRPEDTTPAFGTRTLAGSTTRSRWRVEPRVRWPDARFAAACDFPCCSQAHHQSQGHGRSRSRVLSSQRITRRAHARAHVDDSSWMAARSVLTSRSSTASRAGGGHATEHPRGRPLRSLEPCTPRTIPASRRIAARDSRRISKGHTGIAQHRDQRRSHDRGASAA